MQQTDLIIFTERKRMYHMLTAIAEASETESGISAKLRELIRETQQEAAELYLVASDKIYEINELTKGELNHE